MSRTAPPSSPSGAGQKSVAAPRAADAAQISWHTTPDGERLSVRTYEAAGGPLRGDVLLVHGYLEHGGRYERLARTLRELGLRARIVDLRGHGRSSGVRGHITDFSQYTSDVSAVLFSEQPVQAAPPFLFGHSLGGLIALRVAARHGERLAGVLLSNPYLQNALPIPLSKRILGQVARRVWPTLRAPAGIRQEWLTHDAEVYAEIAADPLMFNTATAGWFHATRSEQARLPALQSLACPLWMGVGDTDRVASPSYNLHFGERVSAPAKQVVRYPGALHELLQDTVKDAFARDVAAFVVAHGARRDAL